MSSLTEGSDGFILFKTAPAKGKWVQLISRLLNNEAPRLALGDERYVESLTDLCNDAKEVLSKEPVVLSVELKNDDKLVLVGDIHGQFRDLQSNILSVQQKVVTGGDKDANDFQFLFLGDYVDRGPHGAEVCMLLLAMKIEYPTLVYLIRGNHEEAQTCRVYGFLQECRAKLDVDCWSKFVEVFKQLPLAAGVSCPSGSFFCTHGGLSPHTQAVEALQFLDRAEYGDHYMMDMSDSEAMDGLLWSDPSEQNGFRQNYRGCGFTFGPDTTANFCAANNMQFICRAHQMVMAGYKWDHEDKLLTLFSAPNYCGINNNKGAIAILDAAAQQGKTRVELVFQVYDSAPASPTAMFGAASPSSAVVEQYFAAAPMADLAIKDDDAQRE